MGANARDATGKWPLSDSAEDSLKTPPLRRSVSTVVPGQDDAPGPITRNNSIGSFRLGPNSRLGSFSEGDGQLSPSGYISTSPATTVSSQMSSDQAPFQYLAVPLTSTVTISFAKGSQYFKLRYSEILIAKAQWGNLRHIEAADHEGGANYGSLIHFFPKSKMPIPHIEQPYTANAQPPFIISFLEEQTVNAAGVVFSAQPHYAFDHWEDCVRFQETLLGQKLNFIAGMSQARSRGRGEECISQNLRIWQASPERRTLMFFTNSQRKENKKYISLSLKSVDKIERAKRSIVLRLVPDSELATQLRVLEIQFLDAHEHIFYVLKQQIDM